MSRQYIGIVFGGQSTEHEVSLQSAINILKAIDKNKYHPVLLRIDKQGEWYLNNVQHVLNSEEPVIISISKLDKTKINVKDSSVQYFSNDSLRSVYALSQLDIIFPIIHGKLGEDGTLQGLFRMANLPFVGSDVLGSAISMDKDFTKRLLSHAGLKVAPWCSFTSSQRININPQTLIKRFGLPLFVKPANQGSSIGISKIYDIKDFNTALDLAFTFDQKVLIEKFIKGREIECAILGNDNPQASPCGEILVNDSFYSYNYKYIEKNIAKIIIPAEINYKTSESIRKISINAFQILECCGMARIDVFLTDVGEIIVNEVNTLPGFTDISTYPKLWQVAGLSYKNLINRLIELAQEHHTKNSQLKNSLD
ncbi:D-alanine--D-alanine ligase [Pantoea sp. Mhis]|uniref:D-alanine--D-alanine ligase n=1 Tax=Pantoea sp. Mhis TaxID=2576759 RepID=UPI00135C40C1|nr:D-alanine--D-alanine ligase [Pantoea sp. Mhis]MXP56398.1 D-alanine--D-alanine ligase [Pantoea sp. Mhis]